MRAVDRALDMTVPDEPGKGLDSCPALRDAKSQKSARSDCFAVSSSFFDHLFVAVLSPRRDVSVRREIEKVGTGDDANDDAIALDEDGRRTSREQRKDPFDLFVRIDKTERRVHDRAHLSGNDFRVAVKPIEQRSLLN